MLKSLMAQSEHGRQRLRRDVESDSRGMWEASTPGVIQRYLVYLRRMSENSDGGDDRWLIVRGRRWRRTDPALAPRVVEELKSRLGAARNTVKQAKKRGDENDLAEARRKVNIAKHGLGERGEYWWEMAVEDRERRAEESLRELR